MVKKRQQYSNQFKFKVALEAVKELKTINEIASAHEVHPSQVKNWKKQLLTEGHTLFGGDEASRRQKEAGVQERELYEQIGRLKMDLEWLKKKGGVSS